MARDRNPFGALIYIGSFKVESGILHISDPCYEDLKSGVSVKKVSNGPWHAFVRHSKEDSPFTKGDERVKELIAFHEHGQPKDKDDLRHIEPRWKKSGQVGVDSGQMSIFDKKFYRADSEAEGRKTDQYGEEIRAIYKDKPKKKKEPGEIFYDACGCLTLPPPLFDNALSLGGTLPHGAVSPSGYGDGGYHVYTSQRVSYGFGSDDREFVNPNISAVRVVFMGDEEDEE